MGDNRVTIPFLDVSVELKYLSLICLVLQNVVLVLMIKYSRVHSEADGPYLVTTAVVSSEALKFVAALVLEFLTTGSDVGEFTRRMKAEIMNVDTIKLSVPGILYTIQNNLLFVALSNLTVAVYQVTAQIKILTTAMFSVFLLQKQISKMQYFSLLLLTGGVGIVQVANSSNSNTSKASTDMNQMVGLIAILSACMTSGFAGVYFEKILKKGRSVSLFIRNVQLAMFGVIIGLMTVYIKDYDQVMEKGFFQGYGLYVYIVIATQACGGLLVAVVMRYADNILKGFATSVSIILATAISAFLFGVPISALFLMGTTLVISAVYIYGKYPAASVPEKVQLPAHRKLTGSDIETTEDTELAGITLEEK